MLLCVSVAEPEAFWDAMLDELDAISPLIEDARPGLAFLDMHGTQGNPQTWIAQTRAVLDRFACALHLGVGVNKIAAYAAARVADGTICESGSEREFLARLPLALLDIDPAIVERLRLLGVEKLGDLARLPHGPFVRRFGPAAAQWHELARGIDRRPFIPRSHAVAIEASIFGEGRAADEAQVLFALRMLLTRIGSDLERCGKRAGALKLSIELEDAATRDFAVPLATPTSHERTLFDMLRAKLDGATFEAPVVGVRLQALQLEEGGEAQGLFSADDFDPQRVAVTIARLEAVLGESVARATTRDAHRLEERFAYEPFKAPARSMPAPRAQTQQRTEIVPQLRLLQVREVPVQLRKGEPAMVDRHAVRQCAGPWRIDERAFIASHVTRDEYDVVLENGTFARIYRQGSHWYLRGVYE